MIEVHVAHNFLNKNFRKNCIFYWFEKFLCMMYYNHVRVSNIILNDKINSYIPHFMPTIASECFNLQLCVFENCQNFQNFHKKTRFFSKF